MTAPPYEWPTRTVGSAHSDKRRRVTAMSSLREVSGICAAVTLYPLACNSKMTLLQQEPSAHAPCTNMIFTSLLMMSSQLLNCVKGCGVPLCAQRTLVYRVICVAKSIQGVEGAPIVL